MAVAGAAVLVLGRSGPDSNQTGLLGSPLVPTTLWSVDLAAVTLVPALPWLIAAQAGGEASRQSVSGGKRVMKRFVALFAQYIVQALRYLDGAGQLGCFGEQPREEDPDGKPDVGERHVRIDERRERRDRHIWISRLSSTLLTTRP